MSSVYSWTHILIKILADSTEETDSTRVCCALHHLVRKQNKDNYFKTCIWECQDCEVAREFCAVRGYL